MFHEAVATLASVFLACSMNPARQAVPSRVALGMPQPYVATWDFAKRK